MGWGSGSVLMDDVIDAVEDIVQDEKTKVILYQRLIKAFEKQDCDTLDECLDKGSEAFEKAYQELHDE